MRGLMFLMAISVAFPAMAGSFDGAAKEDSFDVARAVPDNELAKMRGGFLSAGGLRFDFALQTHTIVDGVAQNDVSISTRNLEGINANDLKQLIQVGQGNQVAALDALAENPALLNIVQNTQDNAVIQRFNTLTVDVSNVAAIRNQALLPAYDFHAVIALR